VCHLNTPELHDGRDISVQSALNEQRPFLAAAAAAVFFVIGQSGRKACRRSVVIAVVGEQRDRLAYRYL
jgi:hypothetical protein